MADNTPSNTNTHHINTHINTTTNTLTNTHLLPLQLEHKDEKKKKCVVVGCTIPAEKEGYCLEHHKLFKTNVETKNNILASPRTKKQASSPNPSPLGTNRHINKPVADVSTASLESELRETWREARKIICKDLPRLAKRMTIEDEHQVLVENGVNIVPENKISTTNTSSTNTTNQNNLTVNTNTMRKSSDTSHTENNNNSNNNSNKDDSNTTITSAVDTVNAKDGNNSSSSDSLIGKNTPKIEMDESKSNDVHNEATNTVTKEEKKEEKKDETSEKRQTWEKISNVVLGVVRRLESPERVAAITNGLKLIHSSIDQSKDFEELVERLFSDYISYQSKTAKVFKICHQAALFPALYYLQAKLFYQVGQVKDVRRSDGWKIRIYVGEAVYVTHSRWEQNLMKEDNPEHFEVLWELRCSFDKDMEDLRAVIIRINDIKFHENVSPQYKESITSVLRGSGYIV